jgi:hypothetical protein
VVLVENCGISMLEMGGLPLFFNVFILGFF